MWSAAEHSLPTPIGSAVLVSENPDFLFGGFQFVSISSSEIRIFSASEYSKQ